MMMGPGSARSMGIHQRITLRGVTCHAATGCYACNAFINIGDRVVERNFNIGIVQMSCGPDPEENMVHATAHVREAAKQGAELVCLPELFQTQYFCQREDTALFELAEPIPGPATQRLGELAAELKITLVASLFERRAPGVYHNTAAVLGSDGNLLGIYRKMHIPDDPLYYEKFYFTPGDLGFKAFESDF